VEKFSRPYTDSERQILRGRKFSTWKHFENFGMKWVFASIILLAPFLLYDRYVADVSSTVELPILIGIEIAAVLIVLYFMNRIGELSWNKNIEHEINFGEAEIIKLRTDKVIKRKDPEDFGSGYYLKIDDNRTLYLEGQYLDELQYSRKFPNTEFEIIRTKWHNELLEIISTGEYLKPAKKLQPFTKEQYKSGNRHFDGDIIETSIDEIK
jgi:hypothetical protein